MLASITFVVFFAVIAVSAKDEQPHFLGPGSDVTVVEGRDATLTCKVANLHSYKVAWLRVDTQTILTIGPHVITKNHRVAVGRGDGSWALTLREARRTDAGRYMCQINSEPMLTQTHLLQVVVPPDIMDASSSGEAIVREMENVALHCRAEGKPQPNITWRREDAAVITVHGEKVTKWSGQWLNMTSVTRESNGAFLCIATNGVPPSVSKRVLLNVLCVPSVWAVQKLVGGYPGSSALLQCGIEANPAPAVYWTHIDSNRVQDDEKYRASMKSEGYKHISTLEVSNVSREDIGSYHCHVENALGTAAADITLYTLATTTTTTTTTETTTIEEETTSFSHMELDAMEDHRKFSDEDNYVVVLSQHQMQNLELTPST